MNKGRPINKKEQKYCKVGIYNLNESMILFLAETVLCMPLYCTLLPQIFTVGVNHFEHVK